MDLDPSVGPDDERGWAVRQVDGDMDVGVRTEILDQLDPAGDSAAVHLFDRRERFRSDADSYLGELLGPRRGQGGGRQFHPQPTEDGAAAHQRHGVQVHGRGPDEPGDEHVGRIGVQLPGRRYLLEDAVAEHRHPIAHGHRFDLVVGDVHGGDAETCGQFRDLAPGLDTQFRVEVRQWLVHEEDPRFAHDGPAHRDPLPLPTGQILGFAGQVGLQVEQACGLADPPVTFRFRHTRDLQRETHVRRDVHVGIQRIVLEHHGDVTAGRRQRGDVVAADPDRAGVDAFQTGEHSQGGGLTRPGRPDQHHEFSVVDTEVEPVHRRGCAGAGIAVRGMVEDNGSHGHPLRPVRETPWTNARWKTRKRISIGRVVMVANAMMSPHWIGGWVWKTAMPCDSGRTVDPRVTSTGHSSSPQLNRNDRIATVA